MKLLSNLPRKAVALCFFILSQSSFAACLTAEAEPNNSDTRANTGLCSGTSVTGSISSSTDYDWYKLDLTAGGVINISLSHASGIDLDWYLYPATGTYVASRSTKNNPEVGSYTAPSAGTYYVRVKNYTGTGSYTLNVTFPSSGGTGGGTGGGAGGGTACTLPSAVNLGLTGNATPKITATTGGTVLMGGGTDVDEAIKWMINKSGGGDFVVIRSTGTNAYNDYIYGLGGVNSVRTLLITSTSQANDACVVQTIRNAGAVFLAGGNQADYINYFNGQGVGNALNYLITTKKAPVGGTSAGMAIMGQYYHPGGAAENSSVLSNPTGVQIGNNFLTNSLLPNLVTEPHFAQRARQPRLTSFLASTIYNYGVTWQTVHGISADEATAVAIDSTGIAKVFGSGNANFVKATGAPETLRAGSSLTWNVGGRALNVYQIAGTSAGTNTFNVSTWVGSGGTTHYWYVNSGSITIN